MAKLRFYYSAMNAGKSTILLQAAFNYQERGMTALLFTPEIDNRSQVGVIASRIGLSANATPFGPTFNFLTHVKEQLQNNTHQICCVMIDEAHFMTKEHVKQLTQIVDELRLPVLAYGLRSDFLGEPFEASRYLLAWAEELIEIKTICHCGSKATMNQRIDSHGNAVWEGEQVEIGGNERYISLCRKHFFKNQAKRPE
ncbi:MAG: thymidine kinase [Alphaproteobacteria bacterium]|mgnify:CR=1 FL=1|nr:thymidine kinase [Alphaproteobacteria bacterium]OJV47118.1 MAG: thymidine kinase [Alphaproteobacteria bacterium 43-37]